MSETDFQLNLSGYRILSLLGKGGMGAVYLAQDEKLKRRVAVKVISEEVFLSGDTHARFLREAQMMATVEHPHVVRLYSFGEFEQRPYFIMEYVEGESLARIIEKRGKLNLDEALLFLQQTTEALEAAWEKQVVHRDIKPSNILIDNRFRVRVADFGLAKPLESASDSSLTKSGNFLGTPAYIAPEQIAGKLIDFRADIYSLGILLYEMLIGELPFKAATSMGLVVQQLNEPTPSVRAKRPELPEGVAQLIDWMTQKDATKRPQSYSQLQQKIHSLIKNPDSLVWNNSAATKTQFPNSFALSLRLRLANRIRQLLSATSLIAMMLAFLVGVALGSLIHSRVASRPRNEVQQEPPVSYRYLTYSGKDEEPSASPDGRFIVFSSSRNSGINQIWLKEISSGTESPLTSGSDHSPRFSPDGTSILFTRDEGKTASLYRISVLGGDPREVIKDAKSGDWSPDGGKIAFIRETLQKNGLLSVLWVSSLNGDSPKEIYRTENSELSFPRWSPDSRLIAVRKATQFGNQRSSIQIVDVNGKIQHRVEAPSKGDISGIFWTGTNNEFGYLLYDAGLDLRISTARLVLDNMTGSPKEQNLSFLGYITALDVINRGRLILEENLSSQNLMQIRLAKNSTPQWLGRGKSQDRQPVFSPSGESLLFSSNRGGNLDIWRMSQKTGKVIRVTEGNSDDYDPAFTPDGNKILWSSSRTGGFEVFMADINGTFPKQITHDGDAENPSMTVDGAWIVYTSYNSSHPGIWKIHPDGTGATRLVEGHADLSEVSPDGKYALYRIQTQNTNCVQVVQVLDGMQVPFRIEVDAKVHSGRARWMPRGKAIAFIGIDENQHSGIFVQDFVPAQDTRNTRRKFFGFDTDLDLESFGISGDEQFLVASYINKAQNILLAEGIPNVLPHFPPVAN